MLLFDIPNCLHFSRGPEAQSNLVEQLFHVVREISTRQVISFNCMGDSVTLKDRHSVSDAISGVENDSRGPA